MPAPSSTDVPGAPGLPGSSHAAGGPFVPTGRQFVIGHGHQQVVATEIGATLRSYTFRGVPIIDGFEVDQWAHSGRGQVLAPWPNRLGEGRYEFRGVAAQAALDEPEHGNAIHGLVRWLRWECKAQAQNIVVLGCELHPTPGYPFGLMLSVEYRLGRTGLVVTTTAANPGRAPVPFGLGFHPYLRVGAGIGIDGDGDDRTAGSPTGEPAAGATLSAPGAALGAAALGAATDAATTTGGANATGGPAPGLGAAAPRIDGAVLTLPARQRLVLDDRALPTGELRPVAGTELDFTNSRSIGPTTMDTAFTSLDRSSDGRATAVLEDPVSSRRIELWVDEHFRYLMVYTGDTLPDIERRRTSLAVEPMTCPPDALRSGRDLVVLGPGDKWSASWGLRAR